MQGILIALIKFYQVTLSLWLGPCCRFHPSCSNYGIEALQRHGVGKGIKLTFYRVVRCRPGGGSGFDPVP